MIELRKDLQYLNSDFLDDRAFNPPHLVPKPDQFALLLGIHGVTIVCKYFIDDIRTKQELKCKRRFCPAERPPLAFVEQR